MTIDPNKTYNIAQLHKLGIFGKTPSTVKNTILMDKLGANILKAKMEGEGNALRYAILGKNISKYLEGK